MSTQAAPGVHTAVLLCLAKRMVVCQHVKWCLICFALSCPCSYVSLRILGMDADHEVCRKARAWVSACDPVAVLY